MTLGKAVEAFLSDVANPHTRRAYAVALRALAHRFDPRAPLGTLTQEGTAERVALWFDHQWSDRSPATINARLNALSAAGQWWRARGWLTENPFQGIRRRSAPLGPPGLLDRVAIESLVAREDLPLRERVLWRMLYESAARACDVLALNVEDLDLADRRARARTAEGVRRVVAWGPATASLLPDLVMGRRLGPLFLTERRPRTRPPLCDTDPVSGRSRLSYRRVAELFAEATGGATLEQFRRSVLALSTEDETDLRLPGPYSGRATIGAPARHPRTRSEPLMT
ncbi:hypothetical protein ACQEU5_15290 [Marinactinospora thermotolerans]|uniref:hypothetical protein n=1 Tax=Marinactinospora thermotolerans TaxID=531310 RepID=UPI003D8F6A83